MKGLSKITAIAVTIAMMASLFAIPFGVFAADESAAEEFVILACSSKSEVTKIIPKATADSRTVKNNEYSAKWAMDDTDGLVVNGLPKDVTPYNELKITLYASTPVTSYVYFSTDNAATDGMDYFGRQISFTEGWQEISLDLNSLGTSRTPSWKDIARLEFNCSGWGQTRVAGAVVYFDSISLAKNSNYKTLEAADPTPTPTPLPDGEAGISRYYEEDFENTDTVNTKNQKDNKVTLEEKNGNHYMQITKAGVSDVHVDTTIQNATRYVIISADFATTQYPRSAQLATCKSVSGQHTFVSLTNTGDIKAGGKVIGKLEADGKFVNVTVAGDFSNSKYSVYIDGEKVIEGLQMGSGGVFGYPTLHRIFLGASNDDAGGNLMVDNIKIYDGITPDDYENTVSVEEAASKAFDELVGNPSPIIDNGSEAVKYMDSAQAVMLNVRSGYIHANGEKYIPDAPAYIKEGRTLLPVRAVSEALGCKVDWDADTRTVTINDSAKIVIDSTEMILPDGSTYTLDVPAEITNDRTFIPLRALCEKVLGKTVFWDDRGLIVLSNSEMNISASNLTSLNNYMLYDRPQAEDLKELFASVNGNTHPRVILNAEQFDALISAYQTNEYIKTWGDNVIKNAENRISAKHETYIIPDGLRLLATCRNVLEKNITLAMAYKLTGNEKYKTYMWEEIENVGNFVDWNHKLHYLDTGEMTTAVAIAYDWLYDDWTEEQRKFMEEAIYKHSITWTQKALYGQCDYSHFFVTANTNWNAVCNGGVGLGAIAVFDKYPDICADILEKNYISLEKMMAEFYPDGAWYEGPGYWDYLMKYIAFFMSTSQVTFGSDFNITKAPGFDKTGQYLINSDGMTGSNNFHDAGSSRLTSPAMFWYSKHMNQPELAAMMLYKMDRYNVAGDSYAMVYYDTSVMAGDNINMPLDSYFGGTEIANLRSSWVNDKGLYVSFHSGKNNVNHAHLDAGTFVADLGGQRFAGDIGSEDYNIDGYWGSEKRYQYYRTRPEGHNCFVINPDSSFGQELNATDKFIAFETKTRGGYAITDLTNSYKPYADSAKRGIMMADERRSILIRDEIRGMKKDVNEVYWFMQMEKTDVEILDNTSVILKKGGVRVKLQVLSDADNCEIMVTDPVVLETSTNLPNQNANAGWKRLAIKFTSGKDLNINVKMSLLYDPLGDSDIVESALDDWSVSEGSATIPDGEIPEFPEAKAITVNGTAIPYFDPSSANDTYVLPYGTTAIPAVSAVVEDHVEIASVVLPETLPGNAEITIRDKNDNRLRTTYTIYLRAANELEIEASDAQDGNPPENCLDGDLSTRWAVEGESWGILRFAEAKTISSVWIATWKADQRQLIFDIEVSEDGENFTQVWSGKTQTTKDELEEFKIPAGTYKAVKLVFHGTTTGTWNSILEVEFK